MKLNETKALFTGFFAALSSALGVLYIPVLLMVLCNAIDFGTGIAASLKRGESLKSHKILWGIVKKVCMWLLVVVGFVVDRLLEYSAEVAGVSLPFTFLVACVVAIWIICSELVSILENMLDIGVSLPPFLMPIIKMIQKATEDKASVGQEAEETQ